MNWLVKTDTFIRMAARICEIGGEEVSRVSYYIPGVGCFVLLIWICSRGDRTYHEQPQSKHTNKPQLPTYIVLDTKTGHFWRRLCTYLVKAMGVLTTRIMGINMSATSVVTFNVSCGIL